MTLFAGEIKGVLLMVSSVLIKLVYITIFKLLYTRVVMHANASDEWWNIYVFLEYIFVSNSVQMHYLSVCLEMAWSVHGDMCDNARFDMKEKIKIAFFPWNKNCLRLNCAQNCKRLPNPVLYTLRHQLSGKGTKGEKELEKTWFPVSCPNIQIESHIPISNDPNSLWKKNLSFSSALAHPVIPRLLIPSRDGDN